MPPCTSRRLDEPWVDWIKRSTRTARKHAEKVGIRLWLDSYLKAKWCWAGHVLRMHPDRLARRAVIWRDSEWWKEEMEEFNRQFESNNDPLNTTVDLFEANENPPNTKVPRKSGLSPSLSVVSLSGGCGRAGSVCLPLPPSRLPIAPEPV